MNGLESIKRELCSVAGHFLDERQIDAAFESAALVLVFPGLQCRALGIELWSTIMIQLAVQVHCLSSKLKQLKS